jgi:lysophospholipase L1-like esterase
MRTHTLAILLAGVAACGASTAARNEAASASAAPSVAPAPESIPLARFEGEIRQFERADSASPPAPGGILFVGSSSIRKWTTLLQDYPNLPVLNRGFGGSTFPELLHYYPRVVLRYRPREIVVYEGDNDLAAGRTPRQVADDYRAFVRRVHETLPSARIVFISIKPSPSRWRLAPAMREANRLVQAITATDSLQTYVDVFTPMVGADGRPRAALFVGDSLHMTPAGYVLWRERVAPVLK